MLQLVVHSRGQRHPKWCASFMCILRVHSVLPARLHSHYCFGRTEDETVPLPRGAFFRSLGV